MEHLAIPHGKTDDLLQHVPIRWTPPHSPYDVAMHSGEIGNPSIKNRGPSAGLDLRPGGDFDAYQQPITGGFGGVSLISPHHCPLPPHPPQWHSSAESPRGLQAAAPRDFPRQRGGRRTARPVDDACAAVARLGGGKIIEETGGGTEPLNKASDRHDDAICRHNDVSCFLTIRRDDSNRRRSFEEAATVQQRHAGGAARVAPLPSLVEKGPISAFESDGPGESSWEKEFLEWTDECASAAANAGAGAAVGALRTLEPTQVEAGKTAAAPSLASLEEAARRTAVAPRLAQTAKLTEDARPKYGNFSLRYFGGSKAAHRAEQHEDGRKLHALSPTSGGQSRENGLARGSGGHYNLFSRSGGRKERAAAAAAGVDAEDGRSSRTGAGDESPCESFDGCSAARHYHDPVSPHVRALPPPLPHPPSPSASACPSLSLSARSGCAPSVVSTATDGQDCAFFSKGERNGDGDGGLGFGGHSAGLTHRDKQERRSGDWWDGVAEWNLGEAGTGAGGGAAAVAAEMEAQVASYKKKLGAMMKFSTWEQQEKQRLQQQQQQQQQEKEEEEEDAGVSEARRAIKNAQEELLFPKYHSQGQQQPQQQQQPQPHQLHHQHQPQSYSLETKLPPGVPTFGSRVGRSASRDSGDGCVTWGDGSTWGGLSRTHGEYGGVGSGDGGFGSRVGRSASRDSGDGCVTWGEGSAWGDGSNNTWGSDVGRRNTTHGEHGTTWGRDEGRSIGECGGMGVNGAPRGREVAWSGRDPGGFGGTMGGRGTGKGSGESGGEWGRNWECGSMGWGHDEAYSMCSNASSAVSGGVGGGVSGGMGGGVSGGVSNGFSGGVSSGYRLSPPPVSNHPQNHSQNHFLGFGDSSLVSNHSHNHARGCHADFSPPISNHARGYADSSSHASMPSPPASAAATSSGVVMPSAGVASSNVASGGGCRVFSPDQLTAATNGFQSANLLGAGAFGQVFKGNLLGCQVAIKRLQGNGWQGEEEYNTEVQVLSRMRHPHIVLLMGHCPAINCLVYEYLQGGDLAEHLSSSPNTTPTAGSAGGAGRGGGAAAAAGSSGTFPVCRPLSWPDRIRILSEVTGALLFLHQHSPPIAHRDLKPQNILLDTSLRAKVADVGLARLIDCGNGEFGGEEGGYGGGNVTARVRGTVGYIDPEEMVTCEVSVLGDVYALGVVMMQMLMGLPMVQQTVKVMRIAHEVLLKQQQQGHQQQQQTQTQKHEMYGRDDHRGASSGNENSSSDSSNNTSSGTSSSRWTCNISESLHKATDVIIERLDDSGGKWDRAVAREVAAIAICCTNRRRASRPDLEREVHEVLVQLAEEAAGRLERQHEAADSHLLCPLSKMRMREPVVAADGYTYEKEVIERWMETSNRSPITGEPFEHPMLTPNNAINVMMA
ncbi:hypothetical protein CLOM_g17904 [Closterium sp. NIES-68]|nr:hypothetical protein CLOM_g17904 [Closterium sp. NIES-68]GJP83482.1 hypothetical protein CLOP_g13628 [Closterium sp. NIES-67]